MEEDIGGMNSMMFVSLSMGLFGSLMARFDVTLTASCCFVCVCFMCFHVLVESLSVRGDKTIIFVQKQRENASISADARYPISVPMKGN